MKNWLILLLRLFPPAFREQFRTDMEEQIRSDFERAAQRGPGVRIGFTVATTLDLVRMGVAERLAPEWTGAHGTARPGGRHESNRDGRWTMGEAISDLRRAMRSLLRAPGFLAVTVVTLGLAIGANAGIFSIVDAVLLNPLPFPHADRLVTVQASAPGTDFPDEFGLSAEFFVEYRDQSRWIENAATFNDYTNTIRVGDRAERVWMSSPSTSLFETLGVEPMLGRLPTPEDEQVALISHSLWLAWFDGEPGVIGQSHYMGDGNRTIIGVMGPEFWFPDDRVLLWLPFTFRPDQIQPGRFGLQMIARTTPDATQEALVEELSVIASRLPEQYGGSAAYAELLAQHRPVVTSAKERILGPFRGPSLLLLGAVGIVLLIACANVANLFVVRAERRQRELAVLKALGAGRARLIGTQMSEALIIAGLAAVLALLLARLTVPLFLQAAPAELPRLGDVHISLGTLLFTAALALGSALLFGLLPALRGSMPDMGRLREAGRGTTRRRPWARDALVAGQTALALVLLIGSGLLLRSFEALRNVDPGYDTEDLFTFQIAPEVGDFSDGHLYARFHLDFKDRIAAMPGVEAVGIIENIPLNEGVSTTRFQSEAMASDPEAGSLVGYTNATGDYFSTAGIALVAGRLFTRSDQLAEHGNVLVSESTANLLWAGEIPVGKRLRSQDQEGWHTVVGVVEDVLQYGFRDDPQPLVYFPLAGPEPSSWSNPSPAYVVKTSRASQIAPEIRAIVGEVAPGAPMYRMFTMEQLASDSMVQLTFTALTLAIASFLALVLGAVGLFGVLSYVVAERTPEIGVRMALGAEAGRVRRMVVVQGARVVFIGVIVGLVVALLATRALDSLLYGVGAVDVGTFGAMSLAMIVVGLLASYLPARRASAVDPIRSLRGET